MIIFFGWVLFIWTMVMVYIDLFRRHDIGGWKKAIWVLFTVFLPLIGTFTYLITQGKSMGERRVQDVRQSQADTDRYIRSVASGNGGGAGSSVEQIANAKHLLDSGAITPEEYAALKKKALVS